MSDRLRFMLKVFKIELEEVENDVSSLLEYYSHRFDSRDITQYVWMENRALLMKEISCVKELEADLATWKAPECDGCGEALESLKDHLKTLAIERGYPKLVSLVIDRIGERVSRYLD